MIRKILSGVLMVLCTGCAVQSMQTEMVRAAMPSRADNLDEDLYAWTMDFAGIQLLLYAVTVQDGTVFANRDGTQIAFDGQDVVLVTGLPGAMGDILVRKQEDGTREHEVRGVEEYRVTCQVTDRVGDVLVTPCRYEAEERVVTFDQRVVLGNDGQILRIEAVLVPGAPPMVLEPMLGRGS